VFDRDWRATILPFREFVDGDHAAPGENTSASLVDSSIAKLDQTRLFHALSKKSRPIDQAGPSGHVRSNSVSFANPTFAPAPPAGLGLHASPRRQIALLPGVVIGLPFCRG
jgi:hypothetical protein